MSQPNLMLVDGVLADYVQDITSFMDKVAQTQLEKQCTDLMSKEDEEAQEQALLQICQHSKVLSQAPVKEFEAAYNLLLHVLSYSTKLDQLMPTLLANLVDNVPQCDNGQLMVLSVLTNLFNILPQQSSLRFSVFNTILSFAGKSGNVHMLQGQFKNLSKWLDEWDVDTENKKAMYIKVSEILAGLDAKTSYKYLYDACLESESQELATSLVRLALTSDFVYDFDQLFGLSSVQALKGSPAFDLLVAVSSGDYESFTKLNETDEAIVRKVKVLTVAKLVFNQESKAISYDKVVEAINVPKEEAEMWLIDTIRAGYIEGRMCQMEERFDVHRTTPVGKFGHQDWKLIQQRLDEWKGSLKEVLDVVRNARENATKDKQNKLKQQQQQQQQQQLQPSQVSA